MAIVDPKVNEYLLSYAQPDNEVLANMERYASERDFPIVGPLCARVLYQTALGIGAKSVFEMGSGFGYTAYWFARAVGAGGLVVHTDGDQANSDLAKDYLSRAGLIDRLNFEVGWAQEIIKRYDGPYDIIYIDVDKQGYPECWELAKARVRLGGYIITDNVLWSGRVTDANPDETTSAILDYTRRAYEDPNFVTTINPLRDGMTLSLRVG